MTALLAVAALCAGAFVVAFVGLGLVASARRAVRIAQGAVATMRDPALDDAAKEKAVQASALRLSGATLGLVGRALLLLAITAVPLLLADVAGVAAWEETTRFLGRWDVILGMTVVVGGLVTGWRAWRS